MQVHTPARLRHTSTWVLPVVGSATLRKVLRVEIHKFVGAIQAQSITPVPPFAGGGVSGADPVVVNADRGPGALKNTGVEYPR